MRNEIVDVVILACVDGDLNISIDVEFVATDVGFFVADVELVAPGVDSLVADVDEGLQMKYYVQFVLGCEHVDWVANMYLILMF